MTPINVEAIFLRKDKKCPVLISGCPQLSHELSIEEKLTELDIADDIVVGDFGPLQPIQQNQ